MDNTVENNIKIEGKHIVLNINPEIYSLQTIYSASYVFLDIAYIILDGDPKTNIIVKIIPKDEKDLKFLGGEFFNELVNYSDYHNRAEKTKKIRESIIQRALITNDPSILQDDELDESLEELDDDSDFSDPDDIAVPWEEKYGKAEVNKQNDNTTE